MFMIIKKHLKLIVKIIPFLVVLIWCVHQLENREKDPLLQVVSKSPLVLNRVAIFIQVGSIIPDQFFSCIKNIATAKASLKNPHVPWLYRSSYSTEIVVDLYASYNKILDTDVLLNVNHTLSNIEGINNFFWRKHDNEGFDIGPFFDQLHTSHSISQKYDLFLKLHSKTDQKWAHHTLQCLCGTESQVISVLKQFYQNPSLGLIGPSGFIFGPTSKLKDIHPILKDKYFTKESPAAAFDAVTIKGMGVVYNKIFGKKLTMKYPELRIVAGTMFWANYKHFQVDKLSHVPQLFKGQFSKSYVSNGAIEHYFERLFGTALRSHGFLLAEIVPAPKVMPIYFPQYHQFKENDEFWGEGFTEWTLLKKAHYSKIYKPLSWDKGGLGYYDLNDQDVRKRQSFLARSAGAHGFLFYHYWFSGSHSPKDHKVMFKILEKMLDEDNPNMPFALSWANEPWNRRWTGNDQDVLLSQEYGDESEWTEHFLYLLSFFQHKNYLKIDNRPVLVLYRVGHIGDNLEPMMKLFVQLAKMKGFNGIHFIGTLGSFVDYDKNTFDLLKIEEFHAAFQFQPLLKAVYGNGYPHDLPLTSLPQYWGDYVGFDARPRRPNFEVPDGWKRTPEIFLASLKERFSSMTLHKKWDGLDENFFFITAWNEWNEQAVLEPSTLYSFGFLAALRESLESIPLKNI